LLNRRLSALPPAVDVVQQHSAWAEPECRRLLKALDGEHESRLLKKSLRFRKKLGRREISRLGWVHPEEWASAMGHFRFLLRR
jgi:hypothetical protein